MRAGTLLLGRVVVVALLASDGGCGARAVPLGEEEEPWVAPEPVEDGGVVPEPELTPPTEADGGSVEPAPPCPPGVEVPTDEMCGDRVDNDCDGWVDEGCPPPPEGCVCVPGALRYCMTPDYDVLGQQRCASDGMDWGHCTEIATGPAACEGLDGWYSPAYLECLVEVGACAQDLWDRDRDMDTWDSVGDCDGIVCAPVRPEGCVCVPGARRFCDPPDYSDLGLQTCDEEGRWGRCEETRLGGQGCDDEDGWYSPSYEACLLVEGYCVEDVWDLDYDGDTSESVGECDEESC